MTDNTLFADSDLGQHTSTRSAAKRPRLVISNGTLEAIKWLGLLLMTLDHINKYLYAEKLPILFEVGRLVMPMFSFVLAYNLARPGAFEAGAYARTFTRLSAWALIACIPYIGLGGVLFGWWPLNILATFAIATLIIWLLEEGGFARQALAVLVFLAGGAVVEFWWPALLLVVGMWAYCKKPSHTRLALIILALASLWIINKNFWALAALPLIAAATKIDLNVPRIKHVFYIYYPLHLSVIWALSRVFT